VPGLDEVTATATAAITLDVASGLVNAGLAYSQGDDLTSTEDLGFAAMAAIPGTGAAESAAGDATRSLTDDAGGERVLDVGGGSFPNLNIKSIVRTPEIRSASIQT
jgi:hypothetical protein